MKKNNKITILTILLSIVIILLLLFPLAFPNYLIFGKIIIDFKYIITSILFIIHLIISLFSIINNKKSNMLFNLKNIVITINKILMDAILIILACDGRIYVVIPVVIIICDMMVDFIRVFVGNKEYYLKDNVIDKWKNGVLIFSIILTLLHNLPFELMAVSVSDYLLIIAVLLSILATAKYYIMAKSYIQK